MYLRAKYRTDIWQILQIPQILYCTVKHLFSIFVLNLQKGYISKVLHNMYCYTAIIMHATLNSFLLIICQFWCSHLFAKPAKEEVEVTLPIYSVTIVILAAILLPSWRRCCCWLRIYLRTLQQCVKCSTSGSNTSTPH